MGTGPMPSMQVHGAPPTRDRGPDANEEVRMAAIHALVDMDSDEATGAMIQLLDHEDPDVRRKAAQALGNN